MGGGTFNARAYASFTSSTASMKTEEIYSSRKLDDYLDPKNIKMRESRDSAGNPNSTPLIVDIDVTGSMGMLADTIARKGLGVLFTAILDKKPISDPHVMFMANGDVTCDSAPLQVSQFEADTTIIDQLTKIYIEHGGGGNNFESYNLPWYFAANFTEHDSLIKRGKRGYLFTIGDEEAPADLTAAQITKVFGVTPQTGISNAVLLDQVQRMYDVYHIVIKEGSHAKHAFGRVMASWTPLLGQHVIPLDDHTLLSETIVSTIEIAEGGSHDAAVAGWGSHAATVLSAVKHLPRGTAPKLLGAA